MAAVGAPIGENSDFSIWSKSALSLDKWATLVEAALSAEVDLPQSFSGQVDLVKVWNDHGKAGIGATVKPKFRSLPFHIKNGELQIDWVDEQYPAWNKSVKKPVGLSPLYKGSAWVRMTDDG